MKTEADIGLDKIDFLKVEKQTFGFADFTVRQIDGQSNFDLWKLDFFERKKPYKYQYLVIF